MRFDAVVVGAGPAGGAAALALTRAGAAVLLVDRATLPRWKVCGACVGPAALDVLEGLGLGAEIEAAGARPLTTLELRAGSARADVRLRGSKALSRSTLDRLLADAASAAGAAVRWGVRVTGVRTSRHGVDVEIRGKDGVELIRAGVVVDATGVGSPLPLDGVGAAEDVAPRSRIGIGAIYEPVAGGRGVPGDRSDGPEPGTIRMVVGHRGYVGMVSVEDGGLNVAAAVDREALAELGPGGAVRALLAEAGCELPAEPPESGWRGTPSLTRRPARAADAGVFRVGDSAGYVEPFTGEGIGWAVSCGVGVAPFVLRARAGHADAAAREWRRWHRSAVLPRQRLCRVLAAALRRPRLVRLGVGLLSVAPRLADPVVGRTGRIAAGLRVPGPGVADDPSAPRPSVPAALVSAR